MKIQAFYIGIALNLGGTRFQTTWHVENGRQMSMYQTKLDCLPHGGCMPVLPSLLSTLQCNVGLYSMNIVSQTA